MFIYPYMNHLESIFLQEHSKILHAYNQRLSDASVENVNVIIDNVAQKDIFPSLQMV